MRIIKTLIAVCVLISILMTCIVAASATLSSNITVYWNGRETEAWAENVCSGPLGYDFWASVHIDSTSTGEFSNATSYSAGVLSIITATTEHVHITYPSPAPLVNCWGAHGFYD